MREIVQSIQNDCFLFFFPSDFWFTESVKYLCFHQKPKFTDSQWGPHFPNLPFKTQLLTVLLSLKPSITSLLIPVNYGCEGQHPLAFRERTSQAESCKLENIKVDFPSRENLWPPCTWESLTQLELRVNWAWCIRPWKSQSSSRSQHAAKGETCSTVWGSGRELMVQKLSETCWLPRITRQCPVPSLCFQPPDVSTFLSLPGSKQPWGKKGKSHQRPRCPYPGLLASLLTLSELISLKLCPVPHVLLPSMVPQCIPTKQKLSTVADGCCNLPDWHK